jgi:hypothetical protein
MNYSDDDDPLLLKAEFILSLCELLVGGKYGLTAVEKTVVDRCVRLTYADYFSLVKKSTIPTLIDFHKHMTKQPEPEARNIALALELYVEGSLDVFSKHTNIDINNRVVVFDIKDRGKQHRTFGIPTGITQNVEDLLISDLARRMLSNSEFIMMLNQASSDRSEIAELLDISERQLGYVTNSPVGQGLMFCGSSIIPFIDKFPQDTKLYKMMTTKPEEMDLIPRKYDVDESVEETTA